MTSERTSDADVAYVYLCLACGIATPYAKWTVWQDDVCACPACGWEHTDDDSNPGAISGTWSDVAVEYPTLFQGLAARWAKSAIERQAEHAALVAQHRDTREALARFGQHTGACDWNIGQVCTCGLDAALASVRAAEESS